MNICLRHGLCSRQLHITEIGAAMDFKQIPAAVALIGAATASLLALAGTVLAAGKNAHEDRLEMRVKDRHAQLKTMPAQASAHGVRVSNRGRISLAPLRQAASYLS
jgi:hypothetical protein